MTDAPLLRASDLKKRYPGVKALDGVSMTIERGEIVGLVGKNGAGKSTLIKMLAGVEHPDSGTIEIDGVATRLRDAQDAHRQGFAFMHQELADAPNLTVAENLALSHRFPRRAGLFVNWRQLRRDAQNVLERLAMTIDPKTPVDELSIVERRMLMIAAALNRDARLVVLDEPTASLTPHEIEQLHAVMRALRDHGAAIVYVSHRLDEIFTACDRVVVMRDGRDVAAAQTSDIDGAQLLVWITGSSDAARKEHRRPVHTSVAPEESLRVEGLTRNGVLQDISFTLHRGEVLGIAGLVGSRRTELVRLIVGADRADAGRIFIRGTETRISSPADALRSGMALLPEDRRHQGVIRDFGITKNMTLASLKTFRRVGAVPVPMKRREVAATRKMMSELGISAPSAEQPVSLLSGGNQQKVILGRWLIHGADVLIFDEPTQGIDVEAKEQIFRFIETLTEAGRSAIFVSSEFQELERICTRVLVLREGRLVETLAGDAISETRILAACYA